jgi:hypothetical protein
VKGIRPAYIDRMVSYIAHAPRYGAIAIYLVEVYLNLPSVLEVRRGQMMGRGQGGGQWVGRAESRRVAGL